MRISIAGWRVPRPLNRDSFPRRPFGPLVPSDRVHLNKADRNFLAIFRPAGRDLIDVGSGSMDVPGLINPPYRQRAPVETVQLSLR